MRLKDWGMALLVAAVVAGSAPAARAGYPERPVTMIVAYTVGGGTDILARTIAPFLARRLGVAVDVVNRPGADGENGFTALATAAPDGYTIGFINTPNLVTIPIERPARFSLADFAPVALLVDDDATLAVSAADPIASLQDLIAAAGRSPAPLAVGTTGIGSQGDFTGLMFARAARLTLSRKPFPGSAAVRDALYRGEVAIAGMGIGEALPDLRAGRLRVLAVAAQQRSPLAPEVPTFREQGYDVLMSSGRGIAAPNGVDPAILQVLERSVEQAVNDPAFQAKARETSLPLRYLNSRDYAQYLVEADDTFRLLLQGGPSR